MKARKPGHGRKDVHGNKTDLRRTKALEQAARCIGVRDFAQAERICLDLLRENPRDPAAVLQLAGLYLQGGRRDMALPLLHKLDEDVDLCDAATCNRLGALWHRCAQLTAAVKVLERAVAQEPRSIEFRFNLGLVLIDMRLPLRALECFGRNLQLAPHHFPSLVHMGVALREADRLQEALETFQRAAAQAPDNIDVYRYLALTHVDLSNIDEAERCWSRVLEIDPDCSLAHLRLAHLRRHGHDIAAMERFYARAQKKPDRINLAFGLGKALEDSGEYDRAFHYLREGNQLKRQQFRFSIDEWRVFFDELKSIFDADFIGRFSGGGSDDDTPIFVLGMPRSGSSLVEQILASHPDVHGAGELKELPALCAEGAQLRSQPFPGYFRYLSDADWRQLGDRYLAALHAKSPGARRITDKMPQNFRFVGVIAIALPRAKIVHCHRNPLDNCWSMYKNVFAEGHPYSYDLSELGRFYRYYRELMAHWNAVLPDRIYNLSYEQLVTDSQGEIERLLAFCELPFDQRCVDFHKSERAVDTMSAAQVKRPINADSVDRWAAFKEHLEPLARELSGG